MRDVESDANCFGVTFMIISPCVSRCTGDNLLYITSVSQLYYKRDAVKRSLLKYVGTPFAPKSIHDATNPVINRATAMISLTPFIKLNVSSSDTPPAE